MKVSITPGSKKKGMLFKQTLHTVSFKVTFSEEEKAKIKALGIAKHAVVEEVPFQTNYLLDLSVGMLEIGKDFEAVFENEGSAEGFISVLKASLKNLKEHMDGYEGKSGAEEFEL